MGDLIDVGVRRHKRRSRNMSCETSHRMIGRLQPSRHEMYSKTSQQDASPGVSWRRLKLILFWKSSESSPPRCRCTRRLFFSFCPLIPFTLLIELQAMKCYPLIPFTLLIELEAMKCWTAPGEPPRQGIELRLPASRTRALAIKPRCHCLLTYFYKYSNVDVIKNVI